MRSSRRLVDPDPGSEALRRSVVRGLGWKTASQLVVQGSRLAVAILLARLLAPHDYGLAGMAFVFSGLALVFTDFALGTALVQRRTLTEADRSTVFWTSFGAGIVCMLLALALAGPIASFYGEPRVRPLIEALAFGFLITSLATTQSALLTRAMNFRALELSEIVSTVVGAAVGISAAAAGYGAWALIVQQLAAGAVATILLWGFSPWRPHLVYSRRSLRILGGFGANLFGSRVLFYLHRNADNLLIGRFLGAVPLGAYALAYNLILVPFGRVVDPVRGVLLPALARIQHDTARVASVWLRVTRLIAALIVPAMLGLIVVAPDFVPVVLGHRWHAATPVLQILAGVGLLQSLTVLNSVVLPVLDRTATLFRFSVVTVILSLAGFGAGLHWGIVGVAAGYLGANVLVVPLYTWLTANALGVPMRVFTQNLVGVGQVAVGVLAAAAGSRLALLHVNIGAGPRLLAVVLAGAAAFVPLYAWRLPDVREEIARLRRGRGLAPLEARPAKP